MQKNVKNNFSLGQAWIKASKMIDYYFNIWVDRKKSHEDWCDMMSKYVFFGWKFEKIFKNVCTKELQRPKCSYKNTNKIENYCNVNK